MAGPSRQTAQEVLNYLDKLPRFQEHFSREVGEEEGRLEVDSEDEPGDDSGSDNDKIESLLVEAYNLRSVAGPSTTPAERYSHLNLDPDMNSDLT